jgi:hypothetical protein
MQTADDTHEGFAPRIALIRVNGAELEPGKDNYWGWEYLPPKVGRPYVLLLDGGKLIKTTVIQKVITFQGRLVIRTMNSFYQVEYLVQGGPGAPPQ